MIIIRFHSQYSLIFSYFNSCGYFLVVECVDGVYIRLDINRYIGKFGKNGILIDSGTIGSNDGPFLYAGGITIDLEENVKSLSNFKYLSKSSENSIKPNFSSI
jgi:hypothetical protein